jgi:hypothetical protein
MEMVVQADREEVSEAVSAQRLAALARALTSAARRTDLAAALDDLAGAARAVSGAEVGLVRVRAAGDRLEVVAVAAAPALAAELEGMQLPAADLPAATVRTLAGSPEAVRRTASRAGARSVLLVPVAADGIQATLELYRAGSDFSAAEGVAAELTAAHAGLVLRAFGTTPGATVDTSASTAL